MSRRTFLQTLFRTAVAAAHPAACLPVHLPEPPRSGRLVILAAGKAAGSMTEVAEQHYLGRGFPPHRSAGLAVTRHGYARPSQMIPMIEAAHPVPDAAGFAAADRSLELAAAAGENDLVLVLISGGASANWTAPARGLSLPDKQAVTRALLRCGASIGEINAVRKHLSRIKGGRLAVSAFPAKLRTLAISDVPGDDPAVIGSGPTVPDPTTLADARTVISHYGLTLPDAVDSALRNSANETPKAGDPALQRAEFHIVARPADAFRAAERAVRAAGYEPVLLGSEIEGEARSIAAEHARFARELRAQGRRAVLLSGGELTVTIRGNGRGGPNQEYALALALALDGAAGISALAADTDGTDGGSGSPDDAAGAFADTETVSRARQIGLDPAAFLADNASTAFFSALGDLLTTGPTFTNVNDFRAILVD